MELDVEGRSVVYTKNELDEITLAYCISVHKSQGSEYPIVVSVFHPAHFVLLERNIIYTAVTRARSCFFLVANPKAVYMAVKKEGNYNRVTCLKSMLREVVGVENEPLPEVASLRGWT